MPHLLPNCYHYLAIPSQSLSAPTPTEPPRYLTMASSTATEASDDGGPPLLRLLHHQDLSLFLPFMLGLSDHGPTPPAQTDRIVLINPITQGTVVLDTPTTNAETLDPLLRRTAPPPSLIEYSSHLPASPSSIEALPRVEIAAQTVGSSASPPCCVICLEEFGEWAREMPCQHRFHGGCIERWLRIHGSCPVCRYRMPVDEAELRKLAGESDDHTSEPYHHHHHHHYSNYGRRDTEIWVSFSFSRNSNTRSSGEISATSGDIQQLE